MAAFLHMFSVSLTTHMTSQCTAGRISDNALTHVDKALDIDITKKMQSIMGMNVLVALLNLATWGNVRIQVTYQITSISDFGYRMSIVRTI